VAGSPTQCINNAPVDLRDSTWRTAAPAKMNVMDVATHIDQLEQHGAGLAAAAERVALTTAVPTCPEWDVRALLAHIGYVHRWAATHVRAGTAAFDRQTEPHFPAPEDDDRVLAWYRAGHAELVDTLRAAPDDLVAMTFLADAGPPRAFWARRQAHETAIHRADAEAAADSALEVDREFALDGIAELLEGFYARRGGKLLADPPLSLRVAPTDATVSWLVSLEPDRRVITRGGDALADCTMRGTAADLYLQLWNRRSPGEVRVEGDPAAVEVWRRLARVRWS
jgi:uncharacterized protein (TIGR03083 family)